MILALKERYASHMASLLWIEFRPFRARGLAGLMFQGRRFACPWL